MRAFSTAILLLASATVLVGGAAGGQVRRLDLAGVSGVIIVEGERSSEGGRIHSDLRGRLRLALGGVVLEVRDGAGFSVDPETGHESALAPVPERRLDLHDFMAYALESRPLLATVESTDPAGRVEEGSAVDGGRGKVWRDVRGRVRGYRFDLPDASTLEVTFSDWVRLGDLELPSRVKTVDARGTRTWKISGYREEAMPPVGTPTEPRWADERSLPPALIEVLESERAFAADAASRGMKSAFLEWLVPAATVFEPAPVPVEERFAAVDDDPAAQPALEWSPEWVVGAGSRDLAILSGRWRMTAAGGEAPSAFGQYLSVWARSREGWRVLADIGTEQPEERPLNRRATGRVIQALAPRPMMIPDPVQLAAQVEGEFEELAFRDGYLPTLGDRSDPDVIVLREGRPASQGREGLDVPPGLEELGPRIEITGSAASAGHDLLAVWGLLRFEGAPGGTRSLSFLRAWQLEGSRWQIIADVMLEMP